MQLSQFLGAAALICACRASYFDYYDIPTDLQYLYKELQNKMGPSYYPQQTYGDDKEPNWDDVAFDDTMDLPSVKEQRDYGEAALRDQEYMKQLPITGYQFISGGTGRQEDPEVKTDKVLPAYCTPPNPCPQGYTGGDDCVKDFENSPDNNRRLLGEQDCPCDAEHMATCPPGKKTIDPKSGFVSDGPSNTDVAEDLTSLDDLKLDFDLPLPEKYTHYNYGQQAKSVVKKMAPRF